MKASSWDSSTETTDGGSPTGCGRGWSPCCPPALGIRSVATIHECAIATRWTRSSSYCVPAASGTRSTRRESARARQRTGGSWSGRRQECSGSSGSEDCWRTTRSRASTGAGCRWMVRSRRLRLEGKKTGPNPTDRAKRGTKRSVLTEANGIPISVAVDGANRERLQDGARHPRAHSDRST